MLSSVQAAIETLDMDGSGTELIVRDNIDVGGLRQYWRPAGNKLGHIYVQVCSMAMLHELSVSQEKRATLTRKLKKHIEDMSGCFWIS